MATRQTGLFAVLHTSSVLESRVEARLSGLNLSLAKLAALQRLSEAAGSLPLEPLAERLACVKSNVTQLIDRLEADGLVSRAVEPNDRRSRLAVLTDAGRRAYTTGSGIQLKAEREIFGALTRNESLKLHELLGKLER